MGYPRIVRYAAAVALVAVAARAAASDWAEIAAYPDGLRIDVDRETMESDSAGILTWVRITYAPGAPAASEAYRVRYDCGSRTAAIRYRVRFDPNGVSLGGTSAPLARPEPIIPDTLDDTIRIALCADRPAPSQK